MVHRNNGHAGLRSLGVGWRPVVFAAECGEDGMCPICQTIDFGDCPCPGPTQEDEFEYRVIDGVLMARLRTLPAPGVSTMSSAEETAARSDVPQTVGATVSARRRRAAK